MELEGSDHLPWVGDVGRVLSAIAEFVGEVAARPGERVAAVPAARTRRPATGWEALTDAERRVAKLVAGGLANREVAQRRQGSGMDIFTSTSRPRRRNRRASRRH